MSDEAVIFEVITRPGKILERATKDAALTVVQKLIDRYRGYTIYVSGLTEEELEDLRQRAEYPHLA